MNKELFERYFSDIVMYTFREQDEEQDQYTEEDLAAQQQAAQEAPPEGGYAPAPALEPEVDYSDGVNVATPDPMDPMAPQNPVEISIGRIYELKKIYSKLLAISNLIDNHSDEKYYDLEKRVDEALDMFHIISLNLDKFDKKIDTIIIEFYEFIQNSLEELETLSKQKGKSTDKKEDKDKK